MGWLDDWQKSLAGETETPKPAPRKRIKAVVHSFWLSLRPCRGPEDVGEVQECFYTFEEGVLRLTDSKGVQIGRAQMMIGEGENVRRKAGALAREHQKMGNSDFQRKTLNYERIEYG